MRKLSFAIAALLITASAFAQNSAIQSARNYLREKDFENAVKYINQALDDASTKDKPKTWYAKGDIYMKMMEDPNYQPKLPYKEAADAYLKVVELDPEYEKEDITTKLLFSAYAYYNEGVISYNASKYQEAYDALSNVGRIHGLENGKRYAKNKKFDTLAISSTQMMGYSAYYLKNYDEALNILNSIKENPITKNASLYLAIADIYAKQDKRDQQLAVLQEARKAYPSDANLRNEEINFYIATNRTSELTQKLEDAVAADPNNAELQYTLANIYNNMANPKEGARPANANELIAKAEEGYKKAVASEPSNPEYNFNYSVLYYMQAYDKATQMNALGESAAEMKKYEQLKSEYQALLNKALPLAEKAYSELDSKSKRDARESEIYASTLKELMEIYGKLNKPEKFAEMKKKLDANK